MTRTSPTSRSKKSNPLLEKRTHLSYADSAAILVRVIAIAEGVDYLHKKRMASAKYTAVVLQ